MLFTTQQVKVIRLSNEGAIRYVNVIDNMVVAGSDDGAVRFYDFQMRLLSWFEDINAGPVSLRVVVQSWETVTHGSPITVHNFR